MEDINKLIKEEKYLEALLKLTSDDETSCYYRALIYFKMNKFDTALINIDDCLAKSSKLYYEAIILKVDILVSINRDKEALKILEEELSMPYIPNAYIDEIKDRYNLLNRSNDKQNKSKLDMMEDYELGELLNNSDEEFLYSIVAALSKRNIRNCIQEIKTFLISNKSNIIKSILLEELHRQNVNEEIEVNKNNLKIVTNPSELEMIFDYYDFKDLKTIVDESKNITINELAYRLYMKYLGDIYPLKIDESEYIYIALSCMVVASNSLNEQFDLTNYINKYNLNKKVLDSYIEILNNLNYIII